MLPCDTGMAGRPVPSNRWRALRRAGSSGQPGEGPGRWFEHGLHFAIGGEAEEVDRRVKPGVEADKGRADVFVRDLLMRAHQLDDPKVYFSDSQATALF